MVEELRDINIYEKFLNRLNEIREYEWNEYDVKFYQENLESGQKGVKYGETVLEALARHMTEVVKE